MWCPFSSGQGMMNPIGSLFGWVIFIWFIAFTILVVTRLDGILKVLSKKASLIKQKGVMK